MSPLLPKSCVPVRSYIANTLEEYAWPSSVNMDANMATAMTTSAAILCLLYSNSSGGVTRKNCMSLARYHDHATHMRSMVPSKGMTLLTYSMFVQP